jgi:hypothetical protein
MWLAATVLAAVQTGPAPAFAGAACAPFDTLEAGLDYTGLTGENDLHTWWEPGAGLELWAQTPFYAGDLKLGARFLQNRGKQETSPDYNSLFIYLGWSYPLPVTDWVTVFPGAALGGNIMSFDTEESAGIRYETEVAAELFARLGIRTYGSWRINVAAGWQTMFTYHPVDSWYVSAGLSRAFGMPGWLRGFLE